MYLRVSVTDRCNLRCTYCLPADARFAPERASTAELLQLTRLVCEEAQVYKIRFTGGEPTLCEDLPAHIAQAVDLVGKNIGLTSNGILLKAQLPALQAAGLQRLNISIDAVDAAGFRRISRRDGLDKVIASIDAAKALGFSPLKINAVAMQEIDFPALVRFAIDNQLHLRFIELMAIGIGGDHHDTRFISAADIRARLWEADISLVENRQRDEATSRVWTLPDINPDLVSVGFITTSSEPFCATCDRLRLTSQGHLHTCLFDERGTDLLTPLRQQGEAATRETIRTCIAGKAPPAAFIRHGAMAAIGG